MENRIGFKGDREERIVDTTFFSPKPELRGRLGSLFHSYVQAKTEGDLGLAETIRTEALGLTKVGGATELSF